MELSLDRVAFIVTLSDDPNNTANDRRRISKAIAVFPEFLGNPKFGVPGQTVEGIVALTHRLHLAVATQTEIEPYPGLMVTANFSQPKLSLVAISPLRHREVHGIVTRLLCAHDGLFGDVEVAVVDVTERAADTAPAAPNRAILVDYNLIDADATAHTRERVQLLKNHMIRRGNFPDALLGLDDDVIGFIWK